jgi:hypothetical protein
MDKFTTLVHFVASGNDLDNDLPYLQKIMEVIYKNHALLARDWLGAAIARKKKTPDVEKVDWVHIVNESLDAIRRADVIIAEVTFSDFNQGLQTYIAAQYKKPTLVLTRSEIEGHFISGINDKYLTVKHYDTMEDIESLVSDFIAKNAIPPRDLRFNMFLDRHIYKFLRDMSYETGVNKSEIVRQTLLKAIKQRNDL